MPIEGIRAFVELLQVIQLQSGKACRKKSTFNSPFCILPFSNINQFTNANQFIYFAGSDLFMELPAIRTKYSNQLTKSGYETDLSCNKHS